ncbi:MAG: hypothetical protein NTW86_02460 [Candidatus Sumerlaeota bacterium]|nr:hypothetical protein [Candidatus Sumerlaeota bacterium]
MIPFRRPGGDSTEMTAYVESRVSYYYVRSPLTLYLHRAVYHAVRPLGFDGAQAIALCSAAAGGAYFLALLSISRHPLFLAFNLLAGTTFLFFGHVENYAWVNAMLVVYLALLKRRVDEGAPLWPVALALFLACLFHMLAVFTLPTLLFAALRWNSERRRFEPRVSRDDLEMALLCFVGAAIIVALGPLALAPAAGLDNNFQRLTPLFTNPDPQHFYFTMFSLGHLKMLAYFHWMASPLGLPVLLALGWRLRGRYERFVLGAALCGLAWTSVWHPDMHKGDWDLFSSFAFPLDVLDGLLLQAAWTDWAPGIRRRFRGAGQSEKSASAPIGIA